MPPSNCPIFIPDKVEASTCARNVVSPVHIFNSPKKFRRSWYLS